MKYKESGSTVVLSMIVIVVLAMCVGGALDYTLETFRDAQQSDARSQAVTAATGALDLAFVQWRAACRAQENTVLTASAITSGSYWSPSPSYTSLAGSGALAGTFMNLPGVSNPVSVTLSAMDVTDVNSVADAVADLAAGSPLQTPVSSQAQSQTMPSWSYLARATASFESLKGTQTVNVYRIFQKVTQSPWQYAIFYNNDLEINPGATMNITGSVQTNANLYTGGSDGTNYLNFSGAVHYAGSWDPNGAFDPNDTANDGETPVPPTGETPVQGTTQLPENSSLLTPASTNPNLSDGFHEIIEPPVSGYTDPLVGTSSDPSERYYYQAGVRVLLTGSRTSPTVSVYDNSGTLLTGGTSQTATQIALYNTFSPSGKNTAISYSNLSDYRQSSSGASIPVVQLNMNTVTTALNSSPLDSAVNSNIIYFDDETSSPGALELTNGYKEPSNGVTVVAENPVYIQGDFNTSTSTSDISNVPSNKTSGNNPLIPYAPDYTPSSCAVMSDAVTILSNSWSNSSSNRGANTETASNTTVNAAILSGIVTSGAGFTYSGGVENFPRFLENWSGKDFTYYGSLVELFNSRQGTGVYQEPGHYYNPPVRHWYFNVNFYTSPPPGTFEVISYIKSRWFVE
jgi:hypothetical protein